MRSEKKIKKYKAGMRLSASDVNDLVRRLEKLENLSTAYPLRLDETTNSYVLSLHDYTHAFPFQLKTDLTPGGTAEAYLIAYDMYDGDYKPVINYATDGTTLESPVIKVTDFYTRYRANIGYKGICLGYSDAGENRHLIIDIEQKAEIILFQLSDTLLHTEESKENCHVLKYFRGKDPSFGTDLITVWNPPAVQNGPFGFATAASFVASSTSSFGWIGWATYDPIEDKYWIIDLECVT